MSDKNVWTYALKTHKKGTYLIEEYKKYDDIVAEAQGLNNPDIDYIVYMEETTSEDVDFGRVFLLKMSKVMIESYAKGAPKEDQLKDLSEMLVENLKKNCPDFLNVIPDKYVVYGAFRQEIAYRSVEYGIDLEGKKALDHVNKQTEDDTAIIKSLRDLKFTREQYDPTLNSEQYLLKDLNNGIRWLLQKTGSIESKITSIRNYLEELNYFLWIDLDFLVSFFDKLLKFIGKLNILIKNFKKYTNEGFPVICGLVNGLIEFVAGILEIIKLVVFRPLNLADAELFEHIELEFDMLVELLEEVVELFLKDPDKVFDKVNEAVENYWKSRYQNKEVNIYQHNYFIGEDIVLAIDLVLTVITVVKGLAKVSQKLPKFTQWIDDGLRRRRKKFWKNGIDPDPSFSVWGAGSISHPKLWQEILEEIQKLGCKIKYGETNMVYMPHPSGGLPGTISIPRDCSITALMHEAQHFYDDLAQGFPGFRIFEDPAKVWKMEYDAYMVEIKFLRDNKKFDAANEVLKNAQREKRDIELKYNIKL